MVGDVVLVAAGIVAVDVSYQRMVLPFAPTVALIVPGPQTAALVEVGAKGLGLTVSVAAILAAVLSQPEDVLKLLK